MITETSTVENNAGTSISLGLSAKVAIMQDGSSSSTLAGAPSVKVKCVSPTEILVLTSPHCV